MSQQRSRSLSGLPRVTAKSALSLRYYEFGRQLEQTQCSAAAIPGIAGRLGLVDSANCRYKSRQLFRQISHKELQQLCQPDSKTGRVLSWTHLLALLPLQQTDLRVKLARQAVRDELDAKALRQLIQQTTGQGNRRPGTGRKPKPPRTLLSGVVQAQDLLAHLRFVIEWLRTQPAAPNGRQRLEKALEALQSYLDTLTV